MTEDNNQNVEFESPKPTAGGLVASVLALEEIKNRSFSNRHLELGKMIKCPICLRRHRTIEQLRTPNAEGKDKNIVGHYTCVQQFKELWVEEDLETGEKTTVYATAVQPKGVEVKGQISAEQPTMKQIVGATAFKTKRLNPHPNKRNLQYVELVRALTPDEFDETDLEKAKKRAKRILAKKLGRFGFLPPTWKRQAEAQQVESV